jgi:hypothetical protein
VTKSNVHKLEKFKKVSVIKEFMFDEQDECNSNFNIYENLDGSLQQQHFSPLINGSPDDVLRMTS